MSNKQVTFNADEGLFIIPCGDDGYTNLGLEVCRKRAAKLSAELGESLPEDYRSRRFDDPLALYADYERLVELARKKHAATGWRSSSELTPELVGLEGRRVEVVTSWGKKMRFQVGKSTGFIPCHLAIARRNCHGGPAVVGSPFKSIRIVR